MLPSFIFNIARNLQIQINCESEDYSPKAKYRASECSVFTIDKHLSSSFGDARPSWEFPNWSFAEIWEICPDDKPY